MPYVIYNNNYFTLEDLIIQFPEIMQDIEIDISFDNYKFALNISNIPLNRQANINYIGLERIDTNLLGSDIELGTYTICIPNNIGYCTNYNADYILFRNKVKMDYSDVLSRFTYTLNKTHVEFGNITANIINGTIYIDPSIELQTPDTENVEDTYVDNGFPDTNYGGSSGFLPVRNTSSNTNRLYYKFNLESIIQIPDFENITNAILYLYHNERGGAPMDLNITSHFGNNTIWSESAITWNNQPCGSTSGSFNASCNEIWSDSVIVTDAGGLGTWYNLNVTSIILNYNVTDNLTTVVITAEFTDVESGYKGFDPKESVTPALRPILNVTYTVSNATTTTTVTVGGGNTTTYNLTTTRTLSTITLNLDDTLITFIRYIYIALILFTIVMLIALIDGIPDKRDKLRSRLRRDA